MKRIFTSLCLLVAGTVAAATPFPISPDLRKTPGQTCNPRDPDFVELRYKEKIPYCSRNVSYKTKQQVFALYGITDPKQQEHYTIDHLIPLFAGGSNNISNLWPEPRLVRVMRNVEPAWYTKILKGEATQQETISAILKAKTEFEPTCTSTN